MAKILIEEGYEVSEAADGLDIVNRYREVKPDLILCDVTIPEKDGIAIVKDIMTVDQDAKIIMLTGVDEDVVLLEAMQAGARDCMLKPVDKEVMLQTIQRVLEEE